MKFLRLVLIIILPVSALVLGFLWLYENVQATPVGEQDVEAAVAGWQPLHRNLSNTPTKDSGAANIDGNDRAIVVVWAEGENAENPKGTIIMWWMLREDGRVGMIEVPAVTAGFVHNQPSVALSGDKAFVVWVRTASDQDENEIRYAECPVGTTGAGCTNHTTVNTGGDFSFQRPDIAVDPMGGLHIVWVQEERPPHGVLGKGSIWYCNRVAGLWSLEPERISGCPAEPQGEDCDQDVPAIAVDGERVYVVWDENYTPSPGSPPPPLQEFPDLAGTYFRLRGSVTHPADGSSSHVVRELWEPDEDPTTGAFSRYSVIGKQLSTVKDTDDPVTDDGHPAVAVGNNWVYVMWERLVKAKIEVGYTVYTYSLPYRVYTGTVMSTVNADWWPGGSTDDQWSVMPFTSTSGAITGDYYPGVRPSLKVVSQMPHVVWHRWHVPVSEGGGGDGLAVLGQVKLLQDIEAWVSDYPYSVSYATYEEGTDPGDLEAASTRWMSRTLTVLHHEYILAWPDLTLASADGGTTYDLHVAVHRRREKVGAEGYAWDVWYTNGTYYSGVYLPLFLKTAP